MAEDIIAASTFCFLEDIIDEDITTIASEKNKKAAIFPYWN